MFSGSLSSSSHGSEGERTKVSWISHLQMAGTSTDNHMVAEIQFPRPLRRRSGWYHCGSDSDPSRVGTGGRGASTPSIWPLHRVHGQLRVYIRRISKRPHNWTDRYNVHHDESIYEDRRTYLRCPAGFLIRNRAVIVR